MLEKSSLFWVSNERFLSWKSFFYVRDFTSRDLMFYQFVFITHLLVRYWPSSWTRQGWLDLTILYLNLRLQIIILSCWPLPTILPVVSGIPPPTHINIIIKLEWYVEVRPCHRRKADWLENLFCSELWFKVFVRPAGQWGVLYVTRTDCVLKNHLSLKNCVCCQVADVLKIINELID